MEQWQVQRTAGQCAGTEKKLEPGEEYYAALIDRKTYFERLDFCCQYWQEHTPEVFSFWKTHMPLPNQKKKLFVDDQVLINFFERLADETEPIKINFCFVLALILMRKRIIKYEDSHSQEAKEIWRVRLVREKKIYELVNPNLNDAQIEEVSHELSSILRGEL